MTAEMAEPLRAAVQRYFDGHATGSPSVMRRIVSMWSDVNIASAEVELDYRPYDSSTI